MNTREMYPRIQAGTKSTKNYIVFFVAHSYVYFVSLLNLNTCAFFQEDALVCTSWN